MRENEGLRGPYRVPRDEILIGGSYTIAGRPVRRMRAMVARVVEMLHANAIDEFILVVSPDDPHIEDYFIREYLPTRADVRVHFAHFGGDLRASRAVGVRQVVNAVPVHKEQGRHPPADDGERVRQHLIIAAPVPILIGR